MNIKQYILNIDSMTTTEFCKEHGLPKPAFTGDVKTSAVSFLQIDAIKNRMITEFAKQYEEPKNDLIKYPLVDVTDGWDCEESPTGGCIYNDKLDPAYDSCIICGEPYERK